MFIALAVATLLSAADAPVASAKLFPMPALIAGDVKWGGPVEEHFGRNTAMAMGGGLGVLLGLAAVSVGTALLLQTGPRQPVWGWAAIGVGAGLLAIGIPFLVLGSSRLQGDSARAKPKYREDALVR